MKKKIFGKLTALLGLAKTATTDTLRQHEEQDKPSVLSELRENLAMSEQILYYAEKTCLLMEEQFEVGRVGELEVNDARESLSKAKLFFVQSLCELQNVLSELSRIGRSYALEGISYEKAS